MAPPLTINVRGRREERRGKGRGGWMDGWVGALRYHQGATEQVMRVVWWGAGDEGGCWWGAWEGGLIGHKEQQTKKYGQKKEMKR